MIYLFLATALVITAAMLLWCAVMPDPKDEPFYIDPANTAPDERESTDDL
jgi:hypothetical protein